ncbi:hypothetical protein DL771_006403 [Monosporascus sp. 5C6A]|nr:hypothetical protein DL771_006403 [Monosporascus sp. 5C6A]
MAASSNTTWGRRRREIPREKRETFGPKIYYGLTAFGNTLFKDSAARDAIFEELGDECLCFEMEAAGLINDFPYLVIRGICDYGNSHKNNRWQRYAAATAAAYAKEFLGIIPKQEFEKAQKATDLMESIKSIAHTVEETKTIAMNINDGVGQITSQKRRDDVHSGQWFLQSAAYSAWKTDRNSFLWLNGKPGCGKTILSATIIEDLQKSQPSAQTLLYFYFDFNDTTKKSFENMVRSLTYQLYHRQDVQHHLDLLYSSCGNGKSQPSIDQLCKTLQHMIQQAGEVWIVLDALDECPTRQQHPDGGLLAWIQDRHGSKTNARVRDHKGLSRWRGKEDIQEEIESALMEKADGMFRWVTCQLDALKNCLNYPTLQKALKALPKTLDKTYARILCNIPSDHLPYTIRILQLLTFSERPLRVEEAVDAVAVELTETPRFNIRNRMPVPEEISRYCSSLVAVVKRADSVTDNSITEIQLSHFSVKEWLVSDQLETNLSEHLKETAARATMAEVCLAYLLELNHNLKGLIATWKLIENGADINAQGGHYGNALYAASSERHEKVVSPLLERGANVNAQGGHYGNALQAASSRGYEKVVSLLLKRGANVNAQGGEYGNAFQAASLRGHEKVVSLLLERGADVNAQGGHYGNALQAALEKGHEKIVLLLLERGADVNARGGGHRNALEAASSNGHEKIISLLLEKGAKKTLGHRFVRSWSTEAVRAGRRTY